MSSLVTNVNSSTAQEIVNWVTTADGCVHTADATQLDSWVASASAVCIELKCVQMCMLQLVSLTFSEMSLEYDSGCRFDSVTLYDGSSANSPSRGRFCRSFWSLYTHPSTGPSFFVVFQTDNSYNEGRFSLNWTFGRFIISMSKTAVSPFVNGYMFWLDTLKTAKFIKRWYYSASHWRLGDVMLNNITCIISHK